MPAVAARRLGALDWDFADAQTDEYTHALHPYPAKFPPQLPRQVIQLLSRQGDLVLDPFCGGGTTAVEALVAGRRFFGIDANAVGIAISRAKATTLDTRDMSALKRLEGWLVGLQPEQLLTAEPRWLPTIPNVEKWYDPQVFRALGWIRQTVDEVEAEAARTLALISLAQAAARLSYQDSETRYASRPRSIDLIDVPRMVVRELRRMRAIANRLPLRSPVGSAEFVEGDARNAASFEAQPGAVGLVVTSPPYPNAYDYHLYHRFRLFWLGCDPAELRRVEIGSHLKNQSSRDPTGEYLTDMASSLVNCLRALRPSRYAVLVVGDGIFRGEVFPTAAKLTEVARQVGFDHVVTLTRRLPLDRRSVTKPGRRLHEEQLIFLRRPSDFGRGRIVLPNYTLFPYEHDLLHQELEALGASPAVVDEELSASAVPTFRRAAFAHGLTVDGNEIRTLQYFAEGAPVPGGRRKNSTYFAHGLHRYKGKFYPQLAKCLINLSGLEPGESLVADPFGGSGTVALEAVLNGFDAVSVDCNPIASAIAQSKVDLTRLPEGVVEEAIKRLLHAMSTRPSVKSRDLSQFTTDVLPELERWFPTAVLTKLDWLLAAVRQEPQIEIVRFFEVIVSSIIREVSQQEPKDLRIRRRRSRLEDAPVFELFSERLGEAHRRLRTFWEVYPSSFEERGTAKILVGDSGDSAAFEGLCGQLIHAVVSSPPYAAALPYIDTDRLSLAAVFGYSAGARKALEARMIGSREISRRESAAAEERLLRDPLGLLPGSTKSFLREYKAAVDADSAAGFRLRQAPGVLLRYFESVSRVLRNLRGHVERGAPCWFVVGDSRSRVGGRHWVIPTVNEFASVAQLHGYELVNRLPITVTREDVLHSRHAITNNEIVHLRL